MTARERTEFLLLGPLEVRLDGQSLPLGGAKQRAVLALLLLRAGKVVPIDQIIDEVWGEEPPPSAAHTVEGYVSRLRRVLEPQGASIVREGGGYRFELGGAALDARAAKELVESAADAANAGDHERAAELANEALRRWRGPALRDAPLHGAGRAEAEALDELRLRAVERLVEAELALGRHGDAILQLRPLVDEHPYRERLAAQLMLALYRSGRPAEALAVYERSRKALRDLGLHPSGDLQRLSGDIVRHDPRLAAPVTGEATGIASYPDAPPRGRMRGRRAAAPALVVLVAGAAVAALGFTGGDRSQPELLPNSIVRIDPKTLDPTEVIPVAPRADLVLAAGGYLWITHGMLRYANGAGLRNAGDRTLTRVDPVTGETQPVGGVAPCGLTADPSGDVWVANCYAPGPSANVVRVDADSLEFEETLPVPAGPGFVRGMSYGGGSLWLTDVNGDVAPEERRVIQVDPGTRMSRSIPFKFLPTWLTWSDGYGDLWVGHIGDGSVSRLHTETGEVDTKKSGAQGPGYLMVHRDALWVGDWLSPDVVRIPAVGSGRPHHIPLRVRTRPAGVTTLAAGAGAIWATVPDDHALWRIDQKTEKRTRIPLRYFPWGVSVSDEGIWVTLRANDGPPNPE